MDTTIALVTGAAQGIGRETVRRLAELGWTVWLGARDVEAGEKVAAAIAAEITSTDIRVVQLDVTDDDSVAAAVRTVEAAHGRLDALVNNAGIAGGWVSPRDATPADFLAVYGVNVLGPVRTTHAFLPLLDRSGQPRVVMVSSGLGSFGITTDPARFESTLHNITYPSSKSALNMVASQYAKALDGYQVLIVDPGYTSTAFNGYNGTQTVEQGAEAVVQAATSAPDAPTGTYRDAAGPLPW
ncbi:SDR family NAD(P)-dependent oxidoreductase [Cellulomonas sp.]|uniref:SDR family NAD(P)-dependent oxidoreductase n=1 Tax=Cellulomonas sp. TaxID=40001 RepID=UPI001B0B2299|nr:SDR family NAD(P)-dependent oxidoreductase [Cellulomonas sp.]MBO9556577.1 SDR family NAD(P)-dependent oxidoreductase [Cellulomonas sp.]